MNDKHTHGTGNFGSFCLDVSRATSLSNKPRLENYKIITKFMSSLNNVIGFAQLTDGPDI